MPTLILLRHGQSTWNLENLFTGWVDVDLTEQGEREAVRGGELLAEHGVLPDVVHTSLQIRAIRTAELALRACDAVVDPGAAVVAAERAALRRPAGQEQEGDRREVRRGEAAAVAAVVRRAAAAARVGRVGRSPLRATCRRS